ncbi:hypothetical protein pb186bvf_000984 [Paramecium bursaria]
MDQAIHRSESEIIAIHTLQRQEMEIYVAKKQFEELHKELTARRQQLISSPRVEKQEIMDATKAERFKTMEEHRIPINELEQKLETNFKHGLSSDEAQVRLFKNGLNTLTQKKVVPWFVKLFHELTSVFAILMWTGALLCFIVYGVAPADPSNLYLGIVLAVVVSFTGVLAYFQNEKSEALMEAFKNFIPPETQVLRDGFQQRLPAKDLVVGDIVVVELGKRIPADIRILESHGMKVDNSSLTGESLLLPRTHECTHPDNPLETRNLAFFGTLCKEGSCKGVVVFTGDNTVIGQIAGLAATGDSAGCAILVGIGFLIFGLTTGYDAITSVLFGIGIIIAFVPEGLLATVTVALSLTAKKLAAKKVSSKKFGGSRNSWFNFMHLLRQDRNLNIKQNDKSVKGQNRQKYGKLHKFEYDLEEKGFQELLQCATICSEAVFEPNIPQEKIAAINSDVGLNEAQKKFKIKKVTNEWNDNYQKLLWLDKPTIGDASESALIKFIQPIQDVLQVRGEKKIALDNFGRQAKMPFNSTNKYAFIIVEDKTQDSDYCILTKGAPERIWDLCDKVRVKGVSVNKDRSWDSKFNQINLQYGKNGERVLGFAKLHLPRSVYPLGFQFNLDQFNFPFDKQNFIGLISLIDPPKDAVPDAVIKCKTAGIKVIMVTGDQPVTAAAIAKQCNIITEKTVNEIAEEEGITFEEAMHRSNAIVIHGDMITRMAIDDEGKLESDKGKLLSEWLDKSQIVFARTSPAQKLIIVEGCQKKGHLVAVTGDGVNDSPAIKKADIGISMGISGSDVAKDAADMVLLNDDFSSIVLGIEEGRKIFDNLKRTISFVLCGNIAEILPFLIMIAVQIPLPLTVIQVLCVDLGTALMPSTAFVYEEAELDVMTRKPRNRNERLVRPKLVFYNYALQGFMQFMGAFLCYYITLIDYGFTVDGLFNMQTLTGLPPQDFDVYDPQDIFLGNSILRDQYYQNPLPDFCDSYYSSGFGTIDFLYSKNARADLRMTYISCDPINKRWQPSIPWGECKINEISTLYNKPICYTTEATTHAQSSYYYGVVILQVANYFSLKTHKTSIIFSGYQNPMMFFGFFTQAAIVICLIYIVPVNLALQYRLVKFEHFGFAAVPFGVMMILYSEFRKYMIRNVKNTDGIPNWWVRCMLL